MSLPINGRWKLVSTSGFQDFLKVCGVSSEAMERAKILEITGDAGPKEEFEVTGDTFTRRLITPTGEVKDAISIQCGKEVDAKSLDGRNIKVTITQNSPNQYTRQEAGDGYTATWVRTINGDEMTLVMTSGNVTCTRTLQRI